jgi:hypothetical protein
MTFSCPNQRLTGKMVLATLEHLVAIPLTILTRDRQVKWIWQRWDVWRPYSEQSLFWKENFS